MSDRWPWLALALLGAYHGLNPAMGWLFALSLGLQEKRSAAVLRALVPIGLGHAAAVTLAVCALLAFEYLLPLPVLKWLVAAFLFGLGAYRLFRASHPRGAGMTVGGRDLFFWSFLMASAHGAGLMIVPVLLAYPLGASPHAHMVHTGTVGMMTSAAALPNSVLGGAIALHTAAMLATAAAVALAFFVAYKRAGLNLLRRAWFNFDLLWAVALLLAGLALLFL